MAREVSPRQDVPKPRLGQLQTRAERAEILRQLIESPGWKIIKEDLDRMARTAQAAVDRPPDPAEQPTTRYWNLGYAAALKNLAQYGSLALQMAMLTEEERAELSRG